MQVGNEIIVDYEEILVKEISKRFKKLRGKIPYDVIANGQATAIKRIEKGVIPSSGNFISDALLESYSDYFKMSNQELIFGDENDIEFGSLQLFAELSCSIMPEFYKKKFKFEKSLNSNNKKTRFNTCSFLYVC